MVERTNFEDVDNGDQLSEQYFDSVPVCQTFYIDDVMSPNSEKTFHINITRATSPVPDVRLSMWGKTGQLDIARHKHPFATEGGVNDAGYQSTQEVDGMTLLTNVSTGPSGDIDDISLSDTTDDPSGNSVGILAGTDVPEGVTFEIDTVDKTGSVGDPNGKGATMYDSVGEEWGVDGTTEWDTGLLDVSSEITWSAGEHTVTVKTGATGGRIQLRLEVLMRARTAI